MKKISTTDITDNKVEIHTTVSLKAISTEAIKKTCYRFSDKGFQRLDISGDDEKAIIYFRVSESLTNSQIEDFLASFHRDSLDQDLREIIAEKTENVRNLILLNAFANTDLIETEE